MSKLLFSFAVLLLTVWLKIAYAPIYAAEDPAKITDIVAIIATIITFLAPVAGIAFLIMILFGGFKFVTSGGDPKATGQAKSILTYAVFGVILVVISWLILLLIENLTGVDVTKVKIPEN